MKRQIEEAGFTLLEVMIAVVILAVGLASLFTSEVGAVKIAQRARTTTIATLLARCKMAEVEEKVLKEGWPGEAIDDRDACCTDGEHDGYTCEWKVERIKLPDMGTGDAGVGSDSDDKKDDKGGDKGKSKSGGMLDQLAELGKNDSERMGAITDVLSGNALKSGAGTSDDEDRDEKSEKEKKRREKYGLDEGQGEDPITSMVMGMAFPIMKPVIEEGVRRATVNVKWKEGDREQNFELVQFLVSEQQIILPDSDDENAQPGVPGAPGTGTGTTPGTGTPSTTTTTTTTPVTGTR